MQQLVIDFFGGSGELLPAQPALAPSRLVPFGKYQNQPFDVLLADPEYAIWLLNTMKARLESQAPALLAMLLARYGVPGCTPEHNKLQNRFLDRQFAMRFALTASESVRALAQNLCSLDMDSSWREYVTGVFGAELARNKGTSESATKQRLAKRQRELEEIARSVQLYIGTGVLEASTWRFPVEIRQPEFEVDGADVTYVLSCVCALEGATCSATDEMLYTYAIEPASNTWHRAFGGGDSFRVEVKPIVGDDYPSILRTMKVVKVKYLLVGDYAGRGATWDELVQVFAMSGITAVLLSDVEKTIVPEEFNQVSLRPLTQNSALAIVQEVFERQPPAVCH